MKEAMVGTPLQLQVCTVVAPDLESSSSARLWMSKEAMVSARITTRSLIVVSLRELDSDSPSDPTLGSKMLASLINITSFHFNMQHNSPGGIFALAEVWPSRKLVRFGVRISKMDARRLESSPGFSSQEEPRFVTQNIGNVAAVRSLFEADMSKGMSLVQLFAGRWLCGCYLMPGSLVSLPICGCDCLFMVEALSEIHEDSHVEDSSLPIYKVHRNSGLVFVEQ